MIKKVDILGIQLDNYTVREAIMCVERYLSNNMLNTIESVSMQMLIDSETDPVLKKVLGSLDLAVIGEKEIIQAAGLGNMQRIKECFSAIGHGGKVRSREKGAVRGFPKAHFCRGICGGKMCGRS